MNITIYCGSSFGNDENYKKCAKDIGNWIVKNNYNLVYGGAKVGLMGIVANTVLDGGQEVTGVMPTFLQENERVHDNLTRLITVNDMSERKKKMIDMGDVYIALPGGPGTLEEICEVISWARIGQNKNPCILFNENGYYNNLKNMFDKMVEEGFLTEEDNKKILFSNDFDEIEKFIKEYKK